MRRVVLLLAMVAIAVLMLAATAFPAAAARQSAENAPNAGCPTGFVEKNQNLPPGTTGTPSLSVNASDEACFKVLPNAPQQLKDLIGTDTIEVAKDDVVRQR